MGHRAERTRKVNRTGMVVPRVFSTEGISPFDQVDWDLRTAEIKDERGRVIFQQTGLRDSPNVEPAGDERRGEQVFLRRWHSTHPRARERAFASSSHRVTRTIADWGRDDGYFATADDADRFYDELTALCVNQYGSFNSPVWFNVGLVPSVRNRRAGQQLAVGRGNTGVAKADERLSVSASLGVLHPECRRRYAGHHAAGDLRGDAVQVRVRHRNRPLHSAFEPAKSLPAAADRPVRSASCGSTMRSPA